MNSYIIVVAEEPNDIMTPLREKGMTIYWVDKYHNDTFGIQGPLSIEELQEIPFILSVSAAPAH